MGPIGLAKMVMMGIVSNPSLKGRLGLLVYSCFLSVWTTLALPTTPIEIIAGFSFSLFGSAIAATAGKTFGAVLAFLMGRWLAGPASRLLTWFRGGQQPTRADAGSAGGTPSSLDGFRRQLETSLRQRPVQTIGIIRAAPIPAAVKNYGLSLFPSSVVPLSTFGAVTFCMNMPFSLAWSLAGKSASNLQDAMSGNTGEGGKKTKDLMLTLTALVCLLAAISYLSRRFKVKEFVSGASSAPAEAEMAEAPAAVAHKAGTRRRAHKSPARSSQPRSSRHSAPPASPSFAGKSPVLAVKSRTRSPAVGRR